jgi:GDP-mannose 6-dehydrogenase
LPKDLRALTYSAQQLDVDIPLLGSVLDSNDAHIQRVIDIVLDGGRRRVALLGLSFKVGSDDLRESPFVRLAESLIGKGVQLRIYDPDVDVGSVFGRNRVYIQEHLPHVGQLVSDDLKGVIEAAEVIVVGKPMLGIETLKQLLRTDHVVIDLAGIPELKQAIRPWAADSYVGLRPATVSP